VGEYGFDLGAALGDHAHQLQAAREALWSRKADPAEFLGWIDVPEDTETLREILRYREANDWVEELVVLGIGGSALGAQAVNAALGRGPVRLHFVDNISLSRLRSSCARSSRVRPWST